MDLPVRFVEAWWPLGLVLGGTLSAVALGGVLGGLGEVVIGSETTLGSTLIAIAIPLTFVGGFALLPLLVVTGNLLFIEDTYRKKPEGTRTSRLFLPRWYHRELQRRVAATPDLRSRGAGPPAGGVLPQHRPADRPPSGPPPTSSPPEPPTPPPGSSPPRPPPPGAPRG